MRLFRISSVIIAFLLASVLISCNDTANNNVEDNVSSSLDLVKNGETAFTIIRPELYGNDANIDQMKAIRDSFKEKTGIRMNMDVDWVKIGQEPDPEKYEILIGNTNRPESQKALEGLKYNDYVVKIEGNKIVLNGYSPEAQQEAVDYFINEILSDIEKGTDFAFTSDYNHVHKAEYPMDAVTFAGEEIYPYSIVLPADGDLLKTEFAYKLQQLLADKTGYYLSVVKEASEKSITIENTLNRHEWNYSLNGSTFSCSASGIWGFEMMYDALNEILEEADNTLALDNGWTLEGNVSDSNDADLVRAAITDGDLRIMFHNIWFGEVYNRDEIAAKLYLSYLPDVIGFQEFEPGWYLSDLQDMLLHEYNSVPVSAPQNIKPNIMPIFYRYKRLDLVDSGWYGFAPPEESKGFTWAVFKDKVTGEQFGVASTHYFVIGDETGMELRTKDSETLTSIINELQEKYNVTFILGGDFNCRVDGRALTRLVDLGWFNAQNAATVYKSQIGGYHGYPILDESTKTYQPAEPPKGEYSRSIDHIYVRGDDFEVRVYDVVTHQYSLMLSDHSPIFVDLKFVK